MAYNNIEPSRKPEKVTAYGNEELITEFISKMNTNEKQIQDRSNISVNKNPDGNFIDLKGLFYFLLSKLYIIIIGIIACAVLLGLYGSFIAVPYYNATSKLYIIGQAEDNSYLTNLQIGSWLTVDYQEVFKTWEVNEKVNKQLGTDYKYSELQDMLKIENPNDSNVLYIIVKNTDAKHAADIANAYVRAAEEFITQTMESFKPKIFSLAQVPTEASSLSIIEYIILGLILGLVLTVGVLILIFLLDNRPKSPEDIMNCANLPTLAVVPNTPNLDNNIKYGKKA